MELQEYVKTLQKLMEDRPETKTMKAFTSIDDEGNGYRELYFAPSIGVYFDGGFHDEKHLEEDKEYYAEYHEDEDFTLNAVCVN
tara:strand:- start:9545 stop:9796 length:252 start_codon:yes stop_codon:yes gene_type:complete